MTDTTVTNSTANDTIDIQAQAHKIIETVENTNWQNLWNDWIIPYGLRIGMAIVIFYVGRFLARLVSKAIGKAILASSRDEMLQSFVTSICYFLFLLITLIAAFSQLGLNTSSLVALIGAAGLAVGLALQNSMQNFAAGVMILIFKPFKKGDFIEGAGVSGKVEKMGILMLELRTGDNKTILIPNGKVFADSITNYSRNETRRIDLIFDISYEADIEQAKNIIAQIFQQNANVLREPEPFIAVGALASSSVQIIARPWVQTSNYFSTQTELLEQVKLAFDQADIAIPYNQLDIHFSQPFSISNK